MKEVVPDQTRDDFTQLNTATIASGLDEIYEQRRRVQCQEMLLSQLEHDLSQNQEIPKRPLFELCTSTFNVSCHIVPGAKLQCAL